MRVLRAEYRRVASTRLWWALLVPVVLVAGVVALAGGPPPVRAAFTATLVAVFAAAYGAVSAGGEFRHRTVATAYLAAGGRGRVLVGKLVAGAAVGAVYALVGALVAGPVPAVAVVAVVVAALWGAGGAALGTLVGNQVGAVVGVLVYLLVAEPLLAALLNVAGPPALARLTPYLPGKTGAVAVYDVAGAAVARTAGVTDPPPWWGALAVLGGWVLLAAVLAWTVADHRDVT